MISKMRKWLGLIGITVVLAALLSGLLLAVPALVMHTMDGYGNRVFTESVSPDYKWIDGQNRK